MQNFRKDVLREIAKWAEVKTLNVGSIEKRAIRSVLAAEAVRERAAVKLRLDKERAACKPKNYRDWVNALFAIANSGLASGFINPLLATRNST